jgi:large conductance mechanosensitive channel
LCDKIDFRGDDFMLKEFKEFIARGNVIDLAVGVVIGGAFTSIVNSLVNDIIMPFVSLITGGIDFSNWFVALNGESYETLEAAKEAGAATLNYGNLISVIINFIIVAFVIFLVIKAINKASEKTKKLAKKEEEKKAAAEAPVKSPELQALEEIRDLLKHDVRSKK